MAPARAARPAAVVPKTALPQVKPAPEKPVAAAAAGAGKPETAQEPPPPVPEAVSASVKPAVRTPAETTPVPTTLTLEYLKSQNWSQIAKNVPSSITGTQSSYASTMGAHFKSCKKVTIAGDLITISCSSDNYKFISKNSNKSVIEKILSHHLGRPYRLEIISESVPEPKPDDQVKPKDHLVEAVLNSGATPIDMEEK